MNTADIMVKQGLNIPSIVKFGKYCSVVLGGALLITGTCIGAGMLGLPVSTAAAGFYPTFIIFTLTWLLMTFTALAFLEVSLLLPGETNMISLAQFTLGVNGKRVAWIIYLLFLYSVMAAYTAGGITILAQLFAINVHVTVNLTILALVFALPFAAMIYKGTKIVDYINRFLIAALVVSFLVMCLLASNHEQIIIEPIYQPKFLVYSFPLLVTSFGYHLLIPTLKSYLKENIQQLRWAIFIGGFIPFAIYVFWEYLVLGLVPTWGDNGLVQMLTADGNPADLLIKALAQKQSNVTKWVAYFSFFALITSFVGVGLSIYDFFADGLRIKKTPLGKTSLLMLTFVPPIVYTLIYPRGFLLALGYAGVFAAILLIIYPVLMAWVSRIQQPVQAPYRVAGGKLALLLALLCGVAVIAAEVLSQLGMLRPY